VICLAILPPALSRGDTGQGDAGSAENPRATDRSDPTTPPTIEGPEVEVGTLPQQRLPRGETKATRPSDPDHSELENSDLEAAVARGTDFLVRTQRKDGSWGSGVSRRPIEILAQVPGSHRAFRVGTTALCVLALERSPSAGEAGETAVRAGLEYLLTHHRVRRPHGIELYNVWSFGFGLETLATLLETPRVSKNPVLRGRVEAAAIATIAALGRYQALDGGWGYYDFNAQTFRPSGSAMSFTTATILAALHAAQSRGLAVPTDMVERGLRSLRRLRKEDGSYAYGTYTQYHPAAGFNRISGSLGRTPTCDLALWLHGENVTQADLRRGLERLVRDHHFLDIARKRPWPHEAWYSNSGYYFYYGHYYAARAVELLPTASRNPLRAQLRRLVLARQEPDGSWWDFPLYSYHKPYGTALALLSLTLAPPPAH